MFIGRGRSQLIAVKALIEHLRKAENQALSQWVRNADKKKLSTSWHAACNRCILRIQYLQIVSSKCLIIFPNRHKFLRSPFKLSYYRYSLASRTDTANCSQSKRQNIACNNSHYQDVQTTNYNERVSST